MPTAQRHNNKKNFLAKSNNIAISSRNLRTSTILFDEIKVVVCPAFAESITEGDLRWEKAAGDAVSEDEVKTTVLYTYSWSIVEVSPSKERCAMCEFLGQLSSSYVVNLMIF